MATREEELRQANAENGMMARRFGGAINYAATPVQAPAANINTTVPAVPNVQPTAASAPVQPSLAAPPTGETTPQVQAQSAAQAQQTDMGQGLVKPKQVTAQPMAPGSGVTADPMTDPYGYIEQMYGPRETLEERQERERREYSRQQINNMLGLFTGIGNMLVTSGSRFGRAVKSPDLGEAAAKGIMAREVKRKEEDKTRLAAVQRQQQLDAQREKMKRDADERAWNHAYKVNKDAADDRWRREKDARDAAYRKGKDDRDMAFRREQAERQNRISIGRLAEQRRHNGVMESKSTGRGGRSASYTDVPVPGYDRGVRVSKTAWNAMKKRQMYSELVRENKQWFEDNGWGERDSMTDEVRRMKEEELEQAIVQYIHENPDSEASKRAVQELVRMRDSDPDESGMEEDEDHLY